jgi:hypothetical protein
MASHETPASLLLRSVRGERRVPARHPPRPLLHPTYRAARQLVVGCLLVL